MGRGQRRSAAAAQEGFDIIQPAPNAAQPLGADPARQDLGGDPQGFDEAAFLIEGNILNNLQRQLYILNARRSLQQAQQCPQSWSVIFKRESTEKDALFSYLNPSFPAIFRVYCSSRQLPVWSYNFIIQSQMHLRF